jgi:hypothetical protein
MTGSGSKNQRWSRHKGCPFDLMRPDAIYTPATDRPVSAIEWNLDGRQGGRGRACGVIRGAGPAAPDTELSLANPSKEKQMQFQWVARAYRIVAGGEFCELIAATILVRTDGASS